MERLIRLNKISLKKPGTWLPGHYIIACEVFYLVCRTFLAGSRSFKSKVYTEHLKLRASLLCLGTVYIVSDFDIATRRLFSHMTTEGWEFWTHKYKMAVLWVSGSGNWPSSSQRKPLLSQAVHLVFVVKEVSLRHIFLRQSSFQFQRNVTNSYTNFSLIYYRNYVLLK